MFATYIFKKKAIDLEKYQLIKSLSNKCVFGVFLIKIFDLSNGFIKKLSKKKKIIKLSTH